MFMRFLILLFLCLTTAAGAAFAAQEKPRYRDDVRDIREQEIVEMLVTKGLQQDLPFRIAALDLNGDGVDEWIVRQDGSSNCKAQASCKFYIAGLSERKPALLALITAGELEIMTDRLYGINKLAVYKNPNSDYDFRTYAWTPEKSTFSQL